VKKTIETHEVSEEVITAAKANPSGWVYKIEGTFRPDESVPPEAVVGAWRVDGNGVLTGEFVANPSYRKGVSKDV
jgi:hypothetical protein